MINLTRRAFLTSVSATAIVAVAPPIPAIGAVAAPAVVVPKGLAFAVGTPGEFDWQHFIARNAEEAYWAWWEETGKDDELDEGEERPSFDPEYVTRVEKWDGLRGVTPADWLRADMGHCCDRCGYETSRDQSAEIVNEKVVCEECLTFRDKLDCDPDDAFDDILNRIADVGEEDAREFYVSKGDWDAIDPSLWARAVADCAVAA